MWKHLVLKGGKKGTNMKIRFIYSPEQKKFWDTMEIHGLKFSPQLCGRIKSSLDNSKDGKHAVIEITPDEFITFVNRCEPIKIGTINLLTYPKSPVTL